jgi:HlyD family secretion protein
MNGTVSMLLVELGERVAGTNLMAGTEILRIADLSRMEAQVEVNENDIVRVKLGDTALIEVDAPRELDVPKAQINFGFIT